MTITEQVIEKTPSTVGEWEEAVRVMDSREVTECRMALARLRQWPSFVKAFGWTRLFVLADILEAEDRSRWTKKA